MKPSPSSPPTVPAHRAGNHDLGDLWRRLAGCRSVCFCFVVEVLALFDALILYLMFLRASDRSAEADARTSRTLVVKITGRTPVAISFARSAKETSLNEANIRPSCRPDCANLIK
jgi:hypothetical protein